MARDVLLYDIDGTLIRYGSGFTQLHHEAFSYGFREIYGLQIKLDGKNTSGKTDLQIIKETLRGAGIREEEIENSIPQMRDSMIKYFAKGIGKVDHRANVIPTAIPVLEQLDRDPEIVQGLVTGNLKEIARMKLEAIGIWHYFKVGGFGESSDTRPMLVAAALREAVDKGLIEMVHMAHVYVIGDTPRDILCAKETGAVSVAVATGSSPKQELRRYSPNYLIDNLSELPSILRQRNLGGKKLKL
ncbi:MAG TPA: HAD hydrolase-like protein [Candidatus Saccharimonadales bacterium]|nr:HAD hydrolase-like protein [Candidatus Saccharimonadales bacterium]